MIGLVIQARANSSRLPNKIFLPMKQGGTISVLEYLISRLKQGKLSNDIVVATTTNSSDDQVVEICQRLGIKFHRGPENDVYLRFYQTAKKFNYTDICRICADCPFINVKLIDRMIDIWKEKTQLDILSSLGGPLGVNKYVSFFKINKLHQYYFDFDRSHKEHVTKYFYDHPDKFCLKYILQKSCQEQPLYQIRVNLDTQSDYQLITRIYQHWLNTTKIDSQIDQSYIVKLYEEQPELFRINDSESKSHEYKLCTNNFRSISPNEILLINLM